MNIHVNRVSLGWLVAATLSLGVARAQTIEEYRIPATGSNPLGITSGPGGMWFADAGANLVGRISDTGSITLFRVPYPARGIAAGGDGNLWFTSAGRISRITPVGNSTDFASNGFVIPGYPSSIVSAPDGSLWFTDADIEGGRLGHATLSGSVTERYILSVGAEDPGAIAIGPDGNLWVAIFGNYLGARIERIVPGGESDRIVPGWLLTEYALPGVHGVSAITAGPDGNLWFTETNSNRIGRITPSGAVTEFPVSGGPHGITSGPDGNLWFTEETGNRIGRLTPSGQLSEFPIPTPGARPWDIRSGADGSIWFTEALAGQIGRVILDAAPDAPSLCFADRYCATVSWQTSEGDHGFGHPVPLTSSSGYFWFFDPQDPEVVVKMLDGCSVNGREWVFAAGLTNVSVQLTVTDTLTGLSQTYRNPQGRAFEPIQDTGSFSGCATAQGAGRTP